MPDFPPELSRVNEGIESPEMDGAESVFGTLSLSLEGKTALVCGASGGIGKATAAQLARQGATIIALSRGAEALETMIAGLPNKHGQKHIFLAADMQDVATLTKEIEMLVQKHRVDIVVNNSGGPPPGPVHTATAEAFLAAYHQHILAAHAIMQAVVAGMKEAGSGRFINVISTSVKQPLPNLGVSNTTRGAMASWAKTLARELAPFGITVNNVLPGATATQRLDAIISNKANKTGESQDEVTKEMLAEIPAGRFGLPEELAATIGFLASPAAGYINGINLPVDGGRTLCL